MNDFSDSDFRTVRGYQLANRQEGLLTPALEDYLEMTYRICMKNTYARVGQLSELLNVKPSSASKMIFKLAKLGYIEYDRYGVILMTDIGNELGAHLLSRHDTAEMFLRLIGSRNCLEETELIEHTLSPATVQNLKTLLDFFRDNPSAAKLFDDYKKEKGD